MIGVDVQRIVTTKDAAVAAQQLAAAIDKPIIRVKIEIGPLHVDNLTRTVTLTAVDRLDARFAPTLIRNREGPMSPGRWLFQVYAAHSEYGTAVDLAPMMLKGKSFGQLGYLYTMECDYQGIAAFDVQKKASPMTWLHAGSMGLLRSAGIDWITGVYPAGTEAGDPKV